MKRTAKLALVLLATASLFACSDHAEMDMQADEEEHFMSEKIQAIKKAEAVDQLVQDAAAAQRRRIDEESQ